jgi:glycosyltransferase involved in cell wall biosynthesis
MRELTGVKVCFLAGTLGQGGAERQLYYMLVALQDAGAVPRVLCLTEREYWQERIEALGIQVAWVGQGKSPVRRLVRIIRELKRDRPDILQSQHFFANSYVVAAARMLRLHDIGAIRGDGFEELESNPGLPGWLSLRLPRTLAANSQTAIENAVTLGVARRRLAFLPNAVDATLLTESQRQPGKPVRLLTVGSLVPVKRLDRFLRTISRVSRRASIPVEGIIVGEGPLRAALESQARELGIDKGNVRFCGKASDPGAWYRDADILLLTSDREGTPNVVLEAMAFGLPIVATRVGGLPAVVFDGETGYLIGREDEEALANAVVDLVQDREKRLAFGKRGRIFVQENHTLPQLTASLRQLYNAVLPPDWVPMGARVGSDLRSLYSSVP